jgi:hypothetical protein
MMSVRNRSVLFVGVVAILAGLVGLLRRNGTPTSSEKPLAEATGTSVEVLTAPFAAKPVQSTVIATNRGFAGLTEREKEELGRRFTDRFKPALTNWCNAYAGHIPFDPNDWKPEHFVHRLGENSKFYLYSFVMNNMTLTFQDSKGVGKVFYMTQNNELKRLNELPNGGDVPTVRLPLTREEIVQMLRADAGHGLDKYQIQIRPTGIASAVNGGMTVEVGEHLDNDLRPPAKLSLVFGADRNLSYYLRDPFF